MIGWAFEAMLGASVLMLIVLAVRRPVAGAFGARWAYALWALPAIRLVLPPLPSLPQSDVPTVTVVIRPTVEAMATPAPALAGTGDWLSLLVALWIGGAIVFAIWQHSTYSAFLMHLGSRARRATPATYGGIDVVESDAVDGPVAVGMLKRRIVVPLEFSTRYSPAEQRLALEHELVHHRRGDLWANFAGLFVLAFNWFNPIAHIAFRAFRTDQELACDSAVTRAAPAEREDYARALVKAATTKGMVAACPLNHADTLKRRLKMLGNHRDGRLRTVGGVSAIALMGAAGLVLSAPGMAEERERQQLVIDPAGAPSDIISEADVATLVEACRSAPAVSGGEDDAITCDNGRRIADPEARAIVERTVERAHVRAEAAMPSEAELAEIETTVAKATEAVAKVDHVRIAADVQARVAEALARAPTPRAVVRAGHDDTVDVARIMEEVRVELANVDFGAHERAMAAADVQQALAETRQLRAEAIREAMAEARVAIAEARKAGKAHHVIRHGKVPPAPPAPPPVVDMPPPPPARPAPPVY